MEFQKLVIKLLWTILQRVTYTCRHDWDRNWEYDYFSMQEEVEKFLRE